MVFIGEDNAGWLAELGEDLKGPFGERDWPHLALRRLRGRDEENPSLEVDVLRALVQELAPSHPGIERQGDDRGQML